MTPTEIQSAVAEEMGFFYRDGCYYTDLKVPIVAQKVPNYPFDLNAMHEAEEGLNSSDRVRYYWMLAQVVNSLQTADKITFTLIHATALQRAEAFLRVKGKWKE